MLKKILVGSGSAFALFLMLIFLFGDTNMISVKSPGYETEGSASVLESFTQDKNLTKEISAHLAEQILKDNPNGPVETEEGLKVALNDPGAFVKKAVAAEAGEFSPEDFIYVVANGNVVLAPQSNRQTQLTYIEALGEILSKNLKTGFVAEEIKGVDKKDMFGAMATERDAALAELYRLSVPADLAELHKDILTIVGTQRNIYGTLQNYEADPLRALLAAKFEAEIKTDAEAAISRLNEYIVSQGLNK